MSSHHRRVIEWLEPRKYLAGVTVITHGYNADMGWVDQMADAVAARAGGSTAVSQYELDIDRDSVTDPPYVVSLQRVGNSPPITSATSGEIVFRVDWTNADGGIPGDPFYPTVPSSMIANLIGDALVNPTLQPSIGNLGIPSGFRFVDVPVHLVGHSRGGSVVTDLARQLGGLGIWVDQVTTLDPRPTDHDAHSPDDDPSAGYSSWTVPLYDNVLFGDNYYERNGNTFPFGDYVRGARNFDLTNIVTGGIGPEAHSKIHTYYYGTVARAAQQDIDNKDIVDSWYTSVGQNRATTGFDWSAIGNGTQSPLGLSPILGGSGYRYHVNVNSSQPWSNVAGISLSGGSNGLISNGDSFHINYRYENARSSGNNIVTFYLDDDTNPYDSGAVYIDTQTVAATGTTTPNAQSGSYGGIWIPPNPIFTGLYHLYAAITDPTGQHTRYAYMTQPLYVTGNGAEIITKQWTGDVSSEWSDARNWTPGAVPSAPDRVVMRMNSTSHVDATSGWDTQDLELLSGTLNWSSGSVSSNIAVAPSATLNIDGIDNRNFYGGALNNSGVVNCIGGGAIQLGAGDSIINLAGGLFSVKGNGNLIGFGEGQTFNNLGTFQKTGGVSSNSLVSRLAIGVPLRLRSELLDSRTRRSTTTDPSQYCRVQRCHSKTVGTLPVLTK